MYALIRARVHRGAAVEDVANVCHGDAPFVHPPVAVGSLSNLHGSMIRSQDTPKDIQPRWSYSPRCLILCAVVALMYSRTRGGRSSITRWSSASVSRTSTHSSAYCASLDDPNSSICRSLSSIALLWLGVGIPRRMPRPSPCAQLLRTLLLGTSVDISGGGYHRSSSFTARLVKK